VCCAARRTLKALEYSGRLSSVTYAGGSGSVEDPGIMIMHGSGFAGRGWSEYAGRSDMIVYGIV
jgi:hypothetical protein